MITKLKNNHSQIAIVLHQKSSKNDHKIISLREFNEYVITMQNFKD